MGTHGPRDPQTHPPTTSAPLRLLSEPKIDNAIEIGGRERYLILTYFITLSIGSLLSQASCEVINYVTKPCAALNKVYEYSFSIILWKKTASIILITKRTINERYSIRIAKISTFWCSRKDSITFFENSNLYNQNFHKYLKLWFNLNLDLIP